jgi:hypothetical protein
MVKNNIYFINIPLLIQTKNFIEILNVLIIFLNSKNSNLINDYKSYKHLNHFHSSTHDFYLFVIFLDVFSSLFKTKSLISNFI